MRDDLGSRALNPQLRGGSCKAGVLRNLEFSTSANILSVLSRLVQACALILFQPARRSSHFVVLLLLLFDLFDSTSPFTSFSYGELVYTLNVL